MQRFFLLCFDCKTLTIYGLIYMTIFVSILQQHIEQQQQINQEKAACKSKNNAQ